MARIVHVLVLEGQWRRQQMPLDLWQRHWSSRLAVASLMAMLPIALGVWIASLFAAWHMVFILLLYFFIEPKGTTVLGRARTNE